MIDLDFNQRQAGRCAGPPARPTGSVHFRRAGATATSVAAGSLAEIGHPSDRAYRRSESPRSAPDQREAHVAGEVDDLRPQLLAARPEVPVPQRVDFLQMPWPLRRTSRTSSRAATIRGLQYLRFPGRASPNLQIRDIRQPLGPDVLLPDGFNRHVPGVDPAADLRVVVRTRRPPPRSKRRTS